YVTFRYGDTHQRRDERLRDRKRVHESVFLHAAKILFVDDRVVLNHDEGYGFRRIKELFERDFALFRRADSQPFQSPTLMLAIFETIRLRGSADVSVCEKIVIVDLRKIIAKDF